jgi:uncharacterized repeat protein (TIGR02543 family)
VVQGEKVARPADPARAGYTFGGWFKETACTEAWIFADDVVTNNITLYAKWTIVKYIVVFKLHNDGIHHSAEVEHGSKLSPPSAEPVRAGYRFGGWFRDIAFTEPWNFDTHEVVGDIHLYSKWDILTYSIKYNTNGGNEIPEGTYTVETTVTLPVPARAEYTFAGWYGNAEFVGSPAIDITAGSTGAREYWAKWVHEGVTVHTVTFNTQGGNDIAQQSIAFGEKASPPADPVRTGWIFEGWYREAVCVNAWDFGTDRVRQDTVLYARWTASVYSVVFHALGGSEIASQTGGYGDLVARPADPARTGYTFADWYSDEALSVRWNFDSNTLTGNLNLYAKWNIVTYNITFNTAGGSATPNQQYTVEDRVEFPVPVRTDFIFVGWYDNAACEGSPTASIANTTGTREYWAKWLADAPDGQFFTVSFEAQGGSATASQNNIPEGGKVARPANPTRSGYRFDGWYREAECLTLWNFDSDHVSANLSLYAGWLPVLSADATLQTLTVGEARLQPEFNPSVTDYRVDVDYSISSITINGVPGSMDASVEGGGNIALAVGDNILQLKVRAQDGTEKIYTVTVVRAISNECQLLELSVNNEAIPTIAAVMEYRAGCGDVSATLSGIRVSEGATFTVNGVAYGGDAIALQGAVSNIVISVISASGQNRRDYTLKFVASLGGDNLYLRRWDNVLAINCNPATNGGYTILAVQWYRNNTLVDLEDFIKIEGELSEYRAEVQLEINGSMHRVCPATVRTVSKIIAYPNPVSRGETLTIELPKTYIGGKLSVYTLLGTPIKQNIALQAKTVAISVADLPAGIYLFNITSKTGDVKTIKIVISD